MMSKFKLNPVTERRIRRFVAIKRSYWSLWILLGLYFISLASELISNDKPLYARFEGKNYFPIFAYYPESLFTGSDQNTRPDYKAIAKLPQFANSDKNFMIFAPIPYGPFETVPAEEIEADQTVNISFRRQQIVGTINVDEELRISRSSGAKPFFGVDDERQLRGLLLADSYTLSEAMTDAIAQRLANESELPPLEEIIVSSEGMSVKFSLSTFRPRSRPPTSVRLTLRESVDGAAFERIRLAENGTVFSSQSSIWRQLSDSQKQQVLEAANLFGSEVVDSFKLEVGNNSYSVQFDKEEVAFPFRPVGKHYFGLDSSGRDVLSRILYGLRISLNFGIVLVITTMALGVVIGGIQGYKGGMLDLAGQRLTEIWESLPFLYIMIFMGSVFGRSFLLLLIVYGVFNWIGISYYMRGEFLKLRAQPFVEAAQCLGLSSWKVMSRHIFPNSIVPVVTFFPFYLVGAIFALSALDYLGFGLPPPTPSWGELLSQAQEFRFAWWLVVYPTLALIIVILLGVFIGEGIRAAFDPRTNSRYES